MHNTNYHPNKSSPTEALPTSQQGATKGPPLHLPLSPHLSRHRYAVRWGPTGTTKHVHSLLPISLLPFVQAGRNRALTAAMNGAYNYPLAPH